MAQTYRLPDNIEKAIKLLTEKTGDTPENYIAYTVKAGIEADLDVLSDDHDMAKLPFYFSPSTHIWITWLAKQDRYETPEAFIIRCVRDRVDQIKTPVDSVYSLYDAKRAAGAPDLTPFKNQVYALLDE